MTSRSVEQTEFCFSGTILHVWKHGKVECGPFHNRILKRLELRGDRHLVVFLAIGGSIIGSSYQMERLTRLNGRAIDKPSN
jgi:hypothetical protein